MLGFSTATITALGVARGMMPHTAGKTVAMYFGQPADGEAPVVPEFKHLGSKLSKNFDDSVTIMARIRLARIAFTKLQKAIFGTRRVALESKKIACESLVLSLLLCGSECCQCQGCSSC